MLFRSQEMRIVSDHSGAIIDAVRALSEAYDYVFTSGGIGPTHDDITSASVAAAFDPPIDVRDDARAILEAFYQDGEINEARLRMARIPDGATLILNPVSQAPGFIIRNVHVMAGVPSVFHAMVEEIRPTLRGGAPLLSWSLRVAAPEGELAKPLGEIAKAYPAISVGSYPFFRGGGAGVTLVLRGADRGALEACVEALRQALKGIGVENVEETPPN